MLFNSVQFIFLFLPTTLLLFYGIGRVDHRAAAAFLVASSLFFYGWWDSRYVLLLVTSACGNFLFSEVIARSRGRTRLARICLTLGIAANLAVLLYYKYASFFIANLNALTGEEWTVHYIILPLGISFFTFTQIAFLVDTSRGLVRERGFLNYLLFVTYFPHLIAGPILHHSEMMPQFSRPETYRFTVDRLAIGATLFILGLAKKVLCADQIAALVQTTFDSAARTPIDLLHSWSGALAFCMQIYFDFSAYSDMALGISEMFGIRLPLNFNSPYKSSNIIEFWRCWHMTLSRFLRDYLYIPLGGNRSSPPRRYTNLMITMLLGGLWHGAAWTYVAWGGIQGFYLIINRGWQRTTRGLKPGRILNIASIGLTFTAVTVAWVFFRAPNLTAALNMIEGMVGMNGLYNTAPHIIGFQLLLLPLLMAICWLLPNAYEMLGKFSPALHSQMARARFEWRPNLAWGAGLGVLAALSLSQIVSGPPPPFIYFQF